MLRAVWRIASGNVASQAIMFVGSLIVARIVAPETFGEFARVLAWVAMLGIVGGLRLELAIPRPESATEAYSVLRASWACSATFAALVGCGVFGTLLARGLLGERAPISVRDGVVVVLSACSIALIGMLSSASQMTLREGLYGDLAKRVCVQAIVTSGAQIGLGLMWPTMQALLLGQVLGQAFGVFLLARAFSWEQWRKARAGWTSRSVVREYSFFSLVATPSAVLNSAGLQAPLLLGSLLWGGGFAGWFALTQRILAAPLNILGAAVGQAFIGEFSRSLRSGDAELMGRFDRASWGLLLVGTGVGGGVAWLGPDASAWMLGEAYRASGEYARSLAIGVVPQVVASPLCVVLPLIGRQGVQALWDLVRVVVVVLVLGVAGACSLRPVVALLLLGASNLILYLWLWLETRRALRRHLEIVRLPVQ